MLRQHKRAMFDPTLVLQALVPRSSLDRPDALTVAEVQATALLKMAGVSEPPVEVLELARYLGVHTDHVSAAGALGNHRLDDDGWHIEYGDLTPAARDATVAHQIKLVLDEPFG